MALPPALLQFVEQHGCFSGCYGSNSNLHAFTVATHAPQPMVSVTCMDCLAHVGVLASLLPNGMYSHQLADEVSRHVRAHRGYSVSLSGYHTQGPGFWFGAVYWASCNVFLLDGERSRKLGTDLDLLMLSFQHGVLKPSTPAMLNPASFVVQPLFLDSKTTDTSVDREGGPLDHVRRQSATDRGMEKGNDGRICRCECDASARGHPYLPPPAQPSASAAPSAAPKYASARSCTRRLLAVCAENDEFVAPIPFTSPTAASDGDSRIG